MVSLSSFAIAVLDLRDLVNLPFKVLRSMPTDPLTSKLLGALPIIAFVALLITAIWRQAKKYPTRAIQDSSSQRIRSF